MSKKIYCLNCGKIGHISRMCRQPLTSYGIICWSFNNLKMNSKNVKDYMSDKLIDIHKYNYKHLDNVPILQNYYDNIKFLMIRRKSSINYVDFIRGKYNVEDKEHIAKLMSLMSVEEVSRIKTMEFNKLWEELWVQTAWLKSFAKEFEKAKTTFNKLKELDFYGLTDIKPIYTEPEWEFPKGKRNQDEKPFESACREFWEETGIITNSINILDRTDVLEENFIGNNGLNYRNYYWLSVADKELETNIDSQEVGDAGWFTLPEILSKIRPYNNKKKLLIQQVYFFIVNMYLDNDNNNRKIRSQNIIELV